MKNKYSMKQPHIRAKIIGSLLILAGIILLTIPTGDIYLKTGFVFILIGLFSIFLITEKTIPENISKAQINGNYNAITEVIKNLNLKGNAVFLPSDNLLTEEKIFIPLNNHGEIDLPIVDDKFVFSTGSDGKNMGVALPPSGMPLLHEVEKETEPVDFTLDNVEEKLQTFVGLNLAKSIILKKKQPDSYQLEIEKPLFCNSSSINKQYPCPTCSAVLTAVTKAAKKKIKIRNFTKDNKKNIFELEILN